MSPGAELRIHVLDDVEAAARATAELLCADARAGSSIALSGGSTPRRAYEHAALLEPDWGRAKIWLGDERCVPADDERSNRRLVEEALLRRLSRPPEPHWVDTTLPPDEAAAAYTTTLLGVTLDLVLLGLGGDGHTASLFPRAAALDESEALVIAAEAGLSPWVPRVTLTIPTISAARHVVFLAVGSEKAEPARRAFAERPSRSTPASLVRSRNGPTTVILDRAAAADLPSTR